MVADHCRSLGIGFAVNSVFAEGGKGGEELAQLVVDTIENNHREPLKYIYNDNDPIRIKIQKVCESIYGASSVVYTTLAEKKIKKIESLGISNYPICIAKTQYSFSSDPKALGVPKDFEMKVRDIVINNGAEMNVVIMGEGVIEKTPLKPALQSSASSVMLPAISTTGICCCRTASSIPAGTFPINVCLSARPSPVIIRSESRIISVK